MDPKKDEQTPEEAVAENTAEPASEGDAAESKAEQAPEESAVRSGGEKDEFFDAPPVSAPQMPAGPVYFAQPEFPAKGGKKEVSAETKERGQKRTTAVCAIFLALLIAAVGFLSGWFGYYFSLDPRLRDFIWATETTKKQYYQAIDEEKLYSDIMDALESQIDQYSCFYSKEEYEEVLREAAGENVGIGISLVEEEDGIRVFLVVENSPANIAGIERGMYIVGYGQVGGGKQTGTADELFAFIGEQEGDFVLYCATTPDGADAQARILQKRNYLAAYCMYRDNVTSYSFRGEDKLQLEETRRPVSGLDDDTAYIRIDYFLGNAAEEFEQCLDLMKENGKTDLILDLRCNGGGYMNILAEIASHLCKDAKEVNPVAVTAKYANGSVVRQRCTGNDYSDYFENNSRIVVLADENTASASECLIGAMVDYGTIGYDDIYLRLDPETGTARTYGKGIMQTSFPSLNGAVMKLTVATVHWPVSDTCIHGVGVTPKDGAHAVLAPFLQYGDDLLDEVVRQMG